jgi:hypothetical protein
MPRLVYLSGVGVALVALAFVSTDAALGPRQGVTEANVRRIREGMTLREVEGVLGGKGVLGFASRVGVCRAPIYMWTGPDGQAVVCFSPGGAVESAAFHRATAASPFSRLRAWLGW